MSEESKNITLREIIEKHEVSGIGVNRFVESTGIVYKSTTFVFQKDCSLEGFTKRLYWESRNLIRKVNENYSINETHPFTLGERNEAQDYFEGIVVKVDNAYLSLTITYSYDDHYFKGYLGLFFSIKPQRNKLVIPAEKRDAFIDVISSGIMNTGIQDYDLIAMLASWCSGEKQYLPSEIHITSKEIKTK